MSRAAAAQAGTAAGWGACSWSVWACGSSFSREWSFHWNQGSSVQAAVSAFGPSLPERLSTMVAVPQATAAACASSDMAWRFSSNQASAAVIHCEVDAVLLRSQMGSLYPRGNTRGLLQ